jgi:hypothetical protein
MARPTVNGDVPKSTLWAIKLKRMGIKSLSEWARQRDFPVDTVITVVQRWGNRPDMPLGGIARQVMTALRKDTGMLTGLLVPVINNNEE